MRVELKRKRIAKVPAIKLSREAWDDIGKTVEGSILDNITSQSQADGSPLKRNAKSTRDRKNKAGRPALSLVDKLRRFVKGRQQSWAVFVKPGRSGVIVRPATNELRKLTRYVQEKGYTGWFGISKKGEAAIRAIIRREIRKAFAKAAK